MPTNIIKINERKTQSKRKRSYYFNSIFISLLSHFIASLFQSHNLKGGSTDVPRRRAGARQARERASASTGPGRRARARAVERRCGARRGQACAAREGEAWGAAIRMDPDG